MKTIKLNLDEADIAALDQEAKLGNTTRSELIRNRIRTSAGKKSGTDLTLDDFQTLITKVIRCSGTSLPRPQVETMVATVVAELNR